MPTRPWKRAVGVAAWLVVVSAGGVGFMAGNRATADENGKISQNINDYVATKLDDFTATMKVDSYNEREGAKINKDFGMIYKLKGDIKLRYKEENRLRLDANLGTFIVNNTTQYVRLKAFDFRETRKLDDSPGKRKTLLDVGLLSEGYLAYTQAQFIAARPAEPGGPVCAVFNVSYRDKSLDTSHRLLWIDPQSKVVVKREEYSQLGKLNATFKYLSPKEIAPGIWFPSLVEAYNNEGKKAGGLLYRDVKVNQGLRDNEFKL